jgi:mannose-6-phosphate isomerase-like protein (cupin superfamily)
MSETKYGKYIITELTKKFSSPNEAKFRPEDQTDVLLLDDDVLKGSFLVNAVWFWPERVNNPDPDVTPHQHNYDEVLAVFGTDREDPHDLCGELEAWIGGEKHIITKSFILFIPKGVEHGPFKFTRLDKPAFHFNVCLAKRYT